MASPTPGHAERFAAERGIARHFTDYRACSTSTRSTSSCWACPMTCIARRPAWPPRRASTSSSRSRWPSNLAECDRMIAACERAGVMLGYAEELCFAPKYVRLKQLVDEGALGQGPSGQAVGEARRPPRRLVLRHQSQRRRRDLRHGLPRDRVLPLAPRRPGTGPRRGSRAPTPRWGPTSTATRPTATTRRS